MIVPGRVFLVCLVGGKTDDKKKGMESHENLHNHRQKIQRFSGKTTPSTHCVDLCQLRVHSKTSHPGELF